MRLVQLSVPNDQREAIVAELRDRDLEYTITAGDGEKAGYSYVSFVVPADAVEHVLADLADAGYDREHFTVSISTEFATFRGRDEIQDRWANTPNKIAPTALRSKAKSLRYNTRAYLWMMTLSAVVAVAGLLLGSPAIVVGSMVLAPIVNPMLTSAVGGVRRDRQMLFHNLRMQVVGLGLAVVVAVLFGLFVREVFAVPTTLDVTGIDLIALRLSPGLLSVAVGLAAGAAGAFGLATKGQVSLVGVMIAAALIPTAAAAGIGFAWGEYQVGVGALVLLLIVISAVNVGAYLMLLYLGYGPDAAGGSDLLDRRPATELLVFLATVLVVVGLVGVSVIGFYQQANFERNANAAVTTVLDGDGYEDLGITGMTFEYTGVGPFSDPATVTVTLTRTDDEPRPDLPDRLDERIADRTGEDVLVQIRYVDYQHSGDGSARDVSTGVTLPLTVAGRAAAGVSGARYSA